MAHKSVAGRLFTASLRLRSNVLGSEGSSVADAARLLSLPSAEKHPSSCACTSCTRALSSSSNEQGSPVDFLSRHRRETEEKLEDLTEKGWEKKTPKAAAVENTEEASKGPEVGGPKGPEPTRYGDWERAGRCSDF